MSSLLYSSEMIQKAGRIGAAVLLAQLDRLVDCDLHRHVLLDIALGAGGERRLALRRAERDSAAVVAELTGSLRTARTALRVASSAPSIARAEATGPAPEPAAEPSLPWWASFGVGAAGASLLSWAGHRRRHRTRSIPRAVTETGASDPAAEREPIGV